MSTETTIKLKSRNKELRKEALELKEELIEIDTILKKLIKQSNPPEQGFLNKIKSGVFGFFGY